MEQRSWVRVGLVALVLLVMVAVLGLILLITTPGLSAEQACRNTALLAEGYGPWRQQLVVPSEDAPGRIAVVYNDGVNTLHCRAIQIAGVWFVQGGSRTLVYCGQRLGVECQRGRFGVE
ncbi:MAG: hypothetical protein OHK0022_17140 [Roseiflexaceae bacterium]